MNFVKGYLGIWVQMLLVTSFGVMFSTFLSGPVAMMATLAALVLGFFAQFIFDVAQGAIAGRRPGRIVHPHRQAAERHAAAGARPDHRRRARRSTACSCRS